METDQINKLIGKLQTCTSHLETYRQGKKSVVQFKEIWPDVMSAMAFLQEQQVGEKDKVGVIGTNSYEWVVLDLACIALGIVTVPLDPAVPHDIPALFPEFQLSLVLTNLDEYLGMDRVFSFKEAGSTQRSLPGKEFQPVSYQPEDELTYKFTSGSTQRPKVIAALKQSTDAVLASVQQLFNHGPADKLLVFLPFHTYQQRYWLYSAILFDHDLLVIPKEYVFHSIRHDSPTVIMGVPFFFETLKKIFQSESQDFPERSAEEAREEFQAQLGGRIRYLWTGSAPIGLETLLFYEQMQIPLYQGYGMNEVCIVSKNFPGHNKTGSVGKLLPGKEVRFDENGQILVKSAYPVNTGYYQALPEDNAATFLEDGFVCTGDLGYMDEDGYLYINGRTKDLIVLSNGKKVHPGSVEKKVENTGSIHQCLLYGDHQSHLVALVVPASDSVSERQIKDDIARVNAQLPDHEKILRFFISHTPFSQENGQLSSQNKIIRHKILNEFKSSLDRLYQS